MQDPSQVTIFQQRLVAMNRFIAPLFFVLSLGFLALTYHGLRSVGQWEGPLPETTALWGLIWLYPPSLSKPASMRGLDYREADSTAGLRFCLHYD